MATLHAPDRRSRVRFPDGFVLVFLSRILRIILRGRNSLNFILNILNLECVLAYTGSLFVYRVRAQNNITEVGLKEFRARAFCLECGLK